MKNAVKCVLLFCFVTSFFPLFPSRAASSEYIGVSEGEILNYKVSIESTTYTASFEFTLTIDSISENINTCDVTFTMTGNGDAAKYGFLSGSAQYMVNKTPSDPSPSQYIINKNTIYKNFSGSYGGFQAKGSWDEQGVLTSLLMDGGENSYNYSIILEGRFILQMWIITFLLIATIAFSIILGQWMKKRPVSNLSPDLEKLFQDASEKGGKINLKILSKKLQKSPKLVEMIITELVGLGKITAKIEGTDFIFQEPPSPEAIDAIVTRITSSEAKTPNPLGQILLSKRNDSKGAG